MQQHTVNENAAIHTLRNVCMYKFVCYVLTVRSLGVRVDLGPGFIHHIGSRSLQLRQRVLQLRLALRRKKQFQTHSAIMGAYTTVIQRVYATVQRRTTEGALTKYS